MIDDRDLELFEVVDKTDHVFRRREVNRRLAMLPPGRRAPLLELVPPICRSNPEMKSAADRSRNIVLEEYALRRWSAARGEVRYFGDGTLSSFLPPRLRARHEPDAPSPGASLGRALCRPPQRGAAGEAGHVQGHDGGGGRRSASPEPRRPPAPVHRAGSRRTVPGRVRGAAGCSHRARLAARRADAGPSPAAAARSREHPGAAPGHHRRASSTPTRRSRRTSSPQSMNEEMHSSNEELQTSQEEPSR